MNRYLTKNAVVTLISMVAMSQSGCSTESTESTNIATRALFANMDVEAEQQGLTRVNVELNVGGANGTNVELAGNERLEASVGGVTKTLQEDTDFLDIDYDATFDTSSSQDQFRITFFREDGSINNGSVVNLPDEFTINSPSSGQTFNESGVVAFAWAPGRAGQTIEINLNTSCRNASGGSIFSSRSIEAVDDGAENYPLILLDSLDLPDIDRSQNCSFSVRFVRQQNGILDPAFEAGGSVNAIQARSVENMVITLNP